MNFSKNYKRGFTLVELLVVVAIIVILSAIILASLGSAKDRGNDAAIKSNLKNAINQGEVFYNTNTLYVNSYGNPAVSDICTDPGPVGGAKTVATNVNAAAKASGLASYNRNPVGGGTSSTATCNASATAWAAEAPMKTTIPAPNQMWCVDSTGKSVQTTGSTLGVGDYVCN